VKQVRVTVQAPDPIATAGVVAALRASQKFEVLPEVLAAKADAVVLVCGAVNAKVMGTLRRMASASNAPCVLVTDEIDETFLLSAVECGVVNILPRAMATEDRLVRAVITASEGLCTLPQETQSALLKEMRRLHRDVLAPNGLTSSGLLPREIDVLRVLAEGSDTAEVAMRLAYSERTVKNILHGLMCRLNLRSRTHAVAYALRAGVV
jgi:DNA-binding NarL/FixJ family response regulator